MLAPLATVGAFPTVSSRLTGRFRIHGVRWGSVVLYQLPDQNALHNGTPAAPEGNGLGWECGAPVVTGGAQDRTVVNAAQLVSGTHTSLHG